MNNPKHGVSVLPDGPRSLQGVLTVVAIFQLLAYQKANDLNAANQRATVNVGGPAWQPKLSPDGKAITGWRFEYGLTNSGRLPVKNIIAQMSISLGDKRPDRGLDFNTLPQGPTIQTVIGPGFSFSAQPLEVSVEDMKDVASGKKHLFLWGWATYDDGLSGKKRLTEFCTDFTNVAFSKPDPTDPTSTLIADWPPCQVHDCYDDQCDDYGERTK
jgi:hypothetical protein